MTEVGKARKAKRKPKEGGRIVDRYAPARRLYELRALLNSTGGATVYEVADRLRVSVRSAIRYLAIRLLPTCTPSLLAPASSGRRTG